MILAAGLGTRLKPLTDNKAKALIEVNGIPMIRYVIEKLKDYGITGIIVNVHHFASELIQYLHDNDFGLPIEISDERDILADTGGGIKKARWFFNDHEPFLVYNTDILCDIDLNDFIRNHKQSNAFVTLAVKKRETSRYFLFNDVMKLIGWENTSMEEKIIIDPSCSAPISYGFSGIHILDPGIFQYFENEESFSITKFYLKLARNKLIYGYVQDYGEWIDLGKLENLGKGEQFIRSRSQYNNLT